MKILILCPLFPPNYIGGAEVAAHELGRWLVGRGHEVNVITTAASKNSEREAADEHGMRVWRLHFPRPYYLRDHVRFGGLKKILWHAQDSLDPRNRTRVDRIIDAIAPDVVNIQVLQAMGHNIPLHLARRDLPTVFTLHDYSLACIRATLHQSGKKCGALHGPCIPTMWWKRHCLSRLRRLSFYAPSKAVYRELDRVFPPLPAQREVIPYPMTFTRSESVRERPDVPHFLYVGRLHALKGVLVLLEAARRLSATHKFRLTLVGEGPETEALRSEYGHEPWIRFAGFVANSEVDGFMRSADVLCTPSICEEPFGLVIYQAITLGLPVLGSNAGAIPELIIDGKNGYLIPPGDVEAWHARMRAVCENPAALEHLRAGAVERARDFNVDRLGERVVALFASTIGAGNKKPQHVATAFPPIGTNGHAPATVSSFSVSVPKPPLKVLLLSALFPPNYVGGAEVVAYELGRWLVRQGHQVSVLTGAADGAPDQEGEMEEGMRVWRVRFPRPYVIQDHHRFEGRKKMEWHLRDQFDPRNISIAERVLDAVRPDVVNIHALQSLGYNIPRVLARRNLPVVYALHDHSLACLRVSLFKNGKRCEQLHPTCHVGQAWKWHCLSGIRRLSFFSPSAALLGELDKFVPTATRRREVIKPPMAFPCPTTVPERPRVDGPHFLYVGRLQDIKGVDLLLRAGRRLAAAGRRFLISIVGRGPQGEALQAEFGHEPWVRFVGFVPNTEVGGHMLTADALCAPSIFAEPFGLVIYQAVALGLPVLASNAGGIPELVENGLNGLLLPMGDEAAWEQALARVCDDPALLHTMKEGAARHAGKFDPDVLGERVVSLYRDTIAA
jgi:glycosyltransferase involved in cell wall biosynthesis